MSKLLGYVHPSNLDWKELPLRGEAVSFKCDCCDAIKHNETSDKAYTTVRYIAYVTDVIHMSMMACVDTV